MSEHGQGATPPRNQPPMPSYFRKDRVGRDAFLSQIGHFNEEHRSLFNRLCDFWEPDLSYAKFFSKAGQEYLNAEVSLVNLMANMEQGHCGLLVNGWRDGSLDKERIILTERDDVRFWYWLVENEWMECRASDRRPFPSLANFKERGNIPNDAIQPLALAEISQSFINAHRDDVVVYALPDIDGRVLIVTPATLDLMNQVAKLKIRNALADSPLQPTLSKLLGTVVSELMKSLGSDDDGFWNRLTDAMIVHRDELLAKRASLTNDVFIAAKILKIYTRNEIDEADQRREEEAEKRETIKSILSNLAKKDDFLMTPDELDEQFEPYQKAWPDLKEMFLGQYTRNPGRTGISAVVNVGQDYLYCDHLFPLFRARHKVAAIELRDFYLDMMERMLRTKNKDRITAFSGLEAFREDIREQISDEYPILADLLAKPRMVSEGVMHYASKVLKINDMERIKDLLGRYFEGGTHRFKAPEKLFNLSLKQMFQESYRRLSWFRRLMMRLFGRYDSYDQLFTSAPSATVAKPDQGRTLAHADADDPLLGENRGYSSRSRSRSQESGAEAAARRRREKERRERYSLKQQEDAWSEFRDAYQKKKRS